MCNQQVDGSNPSAGSILNRRHRSTVTQRSRRILWFTIAMIVVQPGHAEGDWVSINAVGDVPVYETTATESIANLILFVGGKGWWGRLDSQNFLIRKRRALVAEGANIYIFPNPSKEKITYKYRVSEQHARRIDALVTHIRNQDTLPVVLVGFSRGAVSVANYATRYANSVDGIALVSGIYRSDVAKRNKFSMESIIGKKVDSRVLILHHQEDQCKVTWPSSVRKFFEALENVDKTLVFLSGGEPTGRKCGPLHFHGFEGVESAAVTELMDWIRAN